MGNEFLRACEAKGVKPKQAKVHLIKGFPGHLPLPPECKPFADIGHDLANGHRQAPLEIIGIRNQHGDDDQLAALQVEHDVSLRPCDDATSCSSNSPP